MRIFETKLFPEGMRREYALGNVASDRALSTGKRHDEVLAAAGKIYPEALTANPFPRIGFLNLMLPVDCNATCPKICYIGRKRTKGISFAELISVVEQFAKAGGKLIRIVGDGEPTLYPQFVELCRGARELNLDVICFTNGVGELSTDILKEYIYDRLYFYVKLWSEDSAKQTEMVCPKKGWVYGYVDGQLGLAPKPFYQLYAIDSERVGFQVIASSLNEDDAHAIMTGLKKDCPMWVEVMIPAGYGYSHQDLANVKGDFPRDCSHGGSPRGGYMATINSLGQFQAGIFVHEGAVSVIEKDLMAIWKTLCLKSELFFQARYETGCFCRRYAQRVAN